MKSCKTRPTAFGADNTIGTWKLKVEKSKYSPAPMPQMAMADYPDLLDSAGALFGRQFITAALLRAQRQREQQRQKQVQLLHPKMNTAARIESGGSFRNRRAC